MIFSLVLLCVLILPQFWQFSVFWTKIRQIQILKLRVNLIFCLMKITWTMSKWPFPMFACGQTALPDRYFWDKNWWKMPYRLWGPKVLPDMSIISWSKIFKKCQSISDFDCHECKNCKQGGCRTGTPDHSKVKEQFRVICRTAICNQIAVKVTFYMRWRIF